MNKEILPIADNQFPKEQMYDCRPRRHTAIQTCRTHTRVHTQVNEPVNARIRSSHTHLTKAERSTIPSLILLSCQDSYLILSLPIKVSFLSPGSQAFLVTGGSGSSPLCSSTLSSADSQPSRRRSADPGAWPSSGEALLPEPSMGIVGIPFSQRVGCESGLFLLIAN